MEEAEEEFEEDSDGETFEELDEGTFNEIDEFASSLPSDSEVSKYHDALQQRLGENNKNKSHLPDEYKRGTFWTQTRSPSFALANTVDPSELYHPRTFIWLPDHLHDNLVCPSCGSGIESKGFDKKTKARRIIDLKEYVIICLVVFASWLKMMRYSCVILEN